MNGLGIWWLHEVQLIVWFYFDFSVFKFANVVCELHVTKTLNELSFGDVIARFLLSDESLANVIKKL
jgi:hypothetical protein